MTAAASLRDSSSVLEADLGKGRVMPQRDRCLFTPPVASLPERESRGQSRPQNLMLVRMRFTTPGHFRTAQRGCYASGISAAGVAFVAEAISVSGHAHANLVQFGYAPREPSVLPVEPIDQGGVSYPLGTLDRPMRMVCSSGQSSTLAIPSLPHILRDMGYLRRQTPTCEIGYNRVRNRISQARYAGTQDCRYPRAFKADCRN